MEIYTVTCNGENNGRITRKNNKLTSNEARYLYHFKMHLVIKF